MKNIITVILLSLCFSAFSQTSKKVLFIGNSYTSANNLPALINSLADADGNTLSFDANVPGGYRFIQHATDQNTLNKIAAEQWDFVVLQAQSQEPSFPDGQVQNEVYPHATTLVNKIYENSECSVPLFYNTWGRQHGESQWEGINTFEKMNLRLFNAYSHMSEEAEGMMSPVGIGFAHIKQDAAAVVDFNALYTGDGSHPSIHGSYLAACIFNNLVFETTSTGNTYFPTNITAAQGQYLQGVADYVVYDVDSVRVDFRPLSNNTFDFGVTDNEVVFIGVLNGGNFISWDFGDGNSSTDLVTTHTYSTEGSYTVTFSTSNTCYTDVISKEVVISTLGLMEEKIQNFKVYPNPSLDGNLAINYSGNGEYTIYTLLGGQVYKGANKQINLEKGMYIFRYENAFQKIVVQ